MLLPSTLHQLPSSDGRNHPPSHQYLYHRKKVLVTAEAEKLAEGQEVARSIDVLCLHTCFTTDFVASARGTIHGGYRWYDEYLLGATDFI
jgi:hypothetical protein